MRTTALLTLLAFGCATVQSPPARPPPASVGRVALAEPQLELWMEGTRPVDPKESARALEASRVALEQAVAGRGLDGVADPEELLVVRVRAIKRTDERKSAQVWSAVGIVFVAVAIVVTAVLLSRSGSKSSRGPGTPRAVVPAGGARIPVRHAHPVPRVYAPPPLGLGVYMGFAVAVPAGPLPPPPGAQPIDALLGGRGWFDGDEVELTVELADPETGAVSWQRTLREGVDPADPVALAAMVDRALAGLPFGNRSPGATENH
jgi:hypothetical protein